MAITARSVTTGAAVITGAAIVVAVVAGVVAQATAPGAQNVAWIPVWDPEGEPSTAQEDGHAQRVTKETYEKLLASVRALDPAASQAIIVPPSIGGSALFVSGVDAVPAPFLLEGRSPGVGEIVLSTEEADERAVTIGDSLPLDRDMPWDAPTEDVAYDSLAVVGLSSAEPDDDVWPAPAWVSVDDAWSLGHAYGFPTQSGPVVIDTYVTWSGDIPPDIEPWVLEN